MATPLVDVTFNQQQLEALQREFRAAPNKINRIQAGAVNDTLKNLRTYVSQELRADLAVKARDLKTRNLVVLQRANRFNPAAHLRVTGSRIPLKYFDVRQGKNVTSWKIYRAGPRKKARDVFFATMPSGHFGVFHRSATKKMQRKPRRAAITEMYGPSVPYVANKIPSLSQTALDAKVGARLQANLDQRIRFELTKD